jgi:two-component system phosphate regulon sensor histidine kinase PhoR
MNRQLTANTVKLIVFFTSLSLVGLMVTQSFWTRRAFIIAQDQFDHSADKALMDVVDELRDFADSSSRFAALRKDSVETVPTHTIFDVIDTNLLASLLNKYIEYHNLDWNYFYAIRKTANDSVIYHSEGFIHSQPLPKPYKACLSCLWEEEYYHLALYFPDKNKSVLLNLSVWLTLTSVFLLVVVLSFIYIIFTILKQKKLSEMKNDFINNMTHEFNTPISTISVASEVLLNAKTDTSHSKIKQYSKIIYDENQRMKSLVERVMRLALYEGHEIKLNTTAINLHELIKLCIHNLCLEKHILKVDIRYELNAADPVIEADEMHVGNIVTNIIDNAIKYSTGNPDIRVITANHDAGVLISFIDKGMGISREVQHHIFENFYRAHTGDVHTIKGYGIGLYYVKSIVDAHGGTVKVTSELNKGSRFDVYLPKVQQK